MIFSEVEVKNKYLEKLANDYLPLAVADSEIRGVVAKLFSDRFALRFERDPLGLTPMTLWFPTNRDEVCWYVYPDKIDDIVSINPENMLYFSRKRPQPYVIKLDYAVLRYFLKKASDRDKLREIREAFANEKVLSMPERDGMVHYLGAGIHDDVPRKVKFLEKMETSFSMIVKRMRDGVFSIAVNRESLFNLFGMYYFKGIVLIAEYNLCGETFVLFKAKDTTPVSNLPHAMIESPEHSYFIDSLAHVLFYKDKDINDFYIADKEAYILSALRFVAEEEETTDNIRVYFKIGGFHIEAMARVRVASYGDVMLVLDKPVIIKGGNTERIIKTLIIPTKNTEHTAQVLDDIVQKRHINIGSFSRTLTNETTYYAQAER